MPPFLKAAAMPKILIVDDEPDVRELVEFNLTKEGWEVIEAENGLEGMKKAKQEHPDLIILDLNMPEMDGMTMFKNLRDSKKTHDIPVLMLTAKKELGDKLEGLAEGADDYVSKPFSTKELVLRVRNLAKRSQKPKNPGELATGAFRLDRNNLKFYLSDEPIDLTATEFKLLLILIENLGEDQDRGELLSRIWGYDERIQTRTLDTHVKRLREKLGDFGDCIETVRGIGYRFKQPPGEGEA